MKELPKDELRDVIVTRCEWIRELVEAIPEVYDALKPISEKHPGHHTGGHLTSIEADLSVIRDYVEQIFDAIREEEGKKNGNSPPEKLRVIK